MNSSREIYVKIEQFFDETWEIILTLAPWLLIGLVAAAVIRFLFPSNFLKHHLGKNKLSSVFKAVIFGVPFPLCSCAVIPAAMGLKKSGASDSATLAFLISTPQSGVDSITVTASFLGWPFAVFKWISAFITGLIGGLITNWNDKRSKTKRIQEEDHPSSTRISCDSINDDDTERKGFKNLFHYALFELLYPIRYWLLLGIFLSAALTTIFPPGALTGTIFGSGIIAFLSILLLSLPLYVCATSSVPIAAALVHAGFPTGAALVFLMAGPATNVATIGAVYRVLGKSCVAIYLSVIIVSSLLLGYSFDFLIDIDKHGMPSHQHSDHHLGYFGFLSAIALIGFFAISIGRDIYRSCKKETFSTTSTESLTMDVRGMSCQSCIQSINRTLTKQASVDRVIVDLKKKKVQIHGSKLVADELCRILNKMGYEARIL